MRHLIAALRCMSEKLVNLWQHSLFGFQVLFHHFPFQTLMTHGRAVAQDMIHDQSVRMKIAGHKSKAVACQRVCFRAHQRHVLVVVQNLLHSCDALSKRIRIYSLLKSTCPVSSRLSRRRAPNSCPINTYAIPFPRRKESNASWLNCGL